MLANWGARERRLTDRVSVLAGMENGRYPSANTLLVRGSSERILIDPSVDVVENGGAPVPVDAIFNSHAHEDHVAGNGLFNNARIHIHNTELASVQSLEAFVASYGYEEKQHDRMAKLFVEEFYFEPRPDAEGFSDGDIFELGDATVEAVHLPGHTRGHSGFRVTDRVFFLSDIDLTGLGPIYADAGSSLEDFEESLLRVRDEDADYYVTSHHKGVIEGRPGFLERVDAYIAVIHRRHAAMLDFLTQPHTIDDMVSHRFIVRSSAKMPAADLLERRGAELHLERMLRRGEARENEPGVFERI